jgi:hypothetical protein
MEEVKCSDFTSTDVQSTVGVVTDDDSNILTMEMESMNKASEE